LVERKSSEKNPETPQQDFVVDKKKKIQYPSGGSVIIPLNLDKNIVGIQPKKCRL